MDGEEGGQEGARGQGVRPSKRGKGGAARGRVKEASSLPPSLPPGCRSLFLAADYCVGVLVSQSMCRLHVAITTSPATVHAMSHALKRRQCVTV